MTAKKFEAARLHFLSDVLVAVAVAVAVVVTEAHFYINDGRRNRRRANRQANEEKSKWN